MTTPVKSNQQHIFIHDAICEGPVEGLIYGDSSVYLDNNRARPLNPDAPYTPLNGTISFTGSTGALSSEVPSSYVGTPNNTNYLVIRAGAIEKTGTPTNNSGVFTIVGDSSFSTDYNTENNLNKSIALVSSDGSEQVYLLGEGQVSSGNLQFTPKEVQYNTANIIQNAEYKVQLVESLEISSIAIDSITVNSAPSLGNTPQYNYFISGSLEPDVEDVDSEAPSVQKVKVQFRNGSTIQDPIVELNGVGGGSSYTGNPQSATPNQLKQLSISTWNASQSGSPENKVPFSDTAAGNPFPNYGTGFYPEGESISSEGAISPTIISATDFGVSLGSVPLLDEVRVSISYNTLYAVSKKDGEETTNTAVYLFQIRKKSPGSNTYNEWQNAFNDGASNVGQIIHTGQNKSAISFEHFIDLEFIKPFVDFEIRITRLTRHKGRACLAQGQDAGNDQELEGGDWTGFVSNITAINKDKFSYPYTAHAGIFLDSREYNSVPKRSYEMRGMRVRVPNGYVPRDYSSVTENSVTIPVYPDFWDGTMSDSLYYTNNPAWVFYDIVVNDRFGAGEWIKEDDIDIYSLYRISKYCDQLVSDGKGGYEPRFTSNLYLSKATDVYKVLKDMATIFTSLIYWMDGKMTTILDAPGDPIYNFSRSNVIDGAFSYETTGQKTKTNQVVVTWNSPELNYEQTTIIVEDRASIVREGRIIKQEAFAFGCTSEGQAQRYGKWKLFTAQGQTELVSFKTSLEGAFIRPGDVIQIQDTARYGAKFSGRIASSSATNVTLDREITLNSTAEYELSIVITEPAVFYIGTNNLRLDSNGDVVGSGGTVYGPGDKVTTNLYIHNGSTYVSTAPADIDTKEEASNLFYLDGSDYKPFVTRWEEDSYVENASISNSQLNVTTLTASFTTTPRPNSVWVITEVEPGPTPPAGTTVGSADLYKVLTISQDDKNIYSISAVEHTNDKYSYVDNPDEILQVPNDVFPSELDFAIAPTQLRILQTSDSSRPDEELKVEWDYPALVPVAGGDLQETTRYLDSFELYHNIPNLESPINVGKRRRSYVFNNVPDGSYVFRIQSISVSGKRSQWLSARYLVDDPFTDNVNRIQGLQTEGLTTHFPYITNALGSFDPVNGYDDYDTTGTVTYSSNDVVTDGGNVLLFKWPRYKRRACLSFC
jgi:predicted phage tail protein